ncbi:MAG: DUF4416 family protein [Acidobacteriota bacterium]
MGKIKPFIPVKLIFGIISGFQQLIEEIEGPLTLRYGPIDYRSPIIPFTFTDYYTTQMGENLLRRFISFQQLIEPGLLPEIKVRSNHLEEEYALRSSQVKRPINLDPGYLTATSLILASTKNYAHRVPLQKGIYAELEYIFKKGEAQSLPWTYPDYRTEGYQNIFLEVRRIYLAQIKK